MKRFISVVTGVGLLCAPVAVSARGPGGHGGFRGGVGFHGGGTYRGGTYRGGLVGYRGGYHGYGYYPGTYRYRYGYGYGFPFFYGAGLGFGFGFGLYSDPWFYGYPGYGFYDYPAYSVTTRAPAVPQPGWEAAIQNGAPTPPAAAPTGQACGHWIWDQDTRQYGWSTDGCVPAGQ